MAGGEHRLGGKVTRNYLPTYWVGVMEGKKFAARLCLRMKTHLVLLFQMIEGAPGSSIRLVIFTFEKATAKYQGIKNNEPS
jgi:hypothetical protein